MTIHELFMSRGVIYNLVQLQRLRPRLIRRMDLYNEMIIPIK
jgi:hypothetical protein